MSYHVTEIFCALQGEGLRAGSRNVFVRFAGCNLTCNEAEHGFDCDTDFASKYGVYPSASELVREIREVWGHSGRGNVILTGGEPGLQVDEGLIATLRENDFYIAIETNGTKVLPIGIDWITCSPKTAEHTLRVTLVDELKYVRAIRQGIPKPSLKAKYYYLSPASGAVGPVRENLGWCMELIQKYPKWRLTVQMHKLWGIR